MKIKLLFLCLTILAFLDSTLTYAKTESKEKLRVVVMDFKADGVAERVSRTISNMIRTELVNNGQFTIIERGQMDAILLEQGFQQTGCTDQDCAVKIGRLLSARKILVGEVSEDRGTLYITMRIVDVESGEVEFAEKEVSSVNERLDVPAVSLTNKFLVRIGKAPKATASKKRNKVPLSFTPGPPPGGFTVSYTRLMPLSSEFKRLYDTMQGGSIGYIYKINTFCMLKTSVGYAYSSGLHSDSKASFNTYTLGGQIGYPLKNIFPYIGFSGTGLWVSEKDDAIKNNFFGYGFNATTGFAFMFVSRFGIYSDVSYSWAKVADDNKTAITGLVVNIGIIFNI